MPCCTGCYITCRTETNALLLTAYVLQRLLKDLVPSALIKAGSESPTNTPGRHPDDFDPSQSPIHLDLAMDSLPDDSESEPSFSFHLPCVIVPHLSALTRLELSLHSTYHAINMGRTDAVGLIRPSDQEIQRAPTALFSSLPALRHIHFTAHPRHQIRVRLDTLLTCTHLTHLSMHRCILDKNAQEDLARVGSVLGALRTLRLVDCQVHTPAAVNGHGGDVGVTALSSILGVLSQLTALQHLCLQVSCFLCSACCFFSISAVT